MNTTNRHTDYWARLVVARERAYREVAAERGLDDAQADAFLAAIAATSGLMRDKLE